MQSFYIKYGEVISHKGCDIRVDHVAAKQRYMISKKDVSLGDDPALNYELIIQNGVLQTINSISLDATVSLETIVDKINTEPSVIARIFDDGLGIIVESREAGLNNNFHISGTALSYLSAEVLSQDRQIIDVYSARGLPFRWVDRFAQDGSENFSFQPGSVEIGYYGVDFMPDDVRSLEAVKDAFNRATTDTYIRASILEAPFQDGSPGYCLRISTLSGRFLNYTGGELFQGDAPDVQVKFSAAQDEEISIKLESGVEIADPGFKVSVEESTYELLTLTIHDDTPF